MDQVSRLNNFDLMRLFGAVLVIYGHSYPLTGAVGPGFAANGIATIGVKIFFVVSGYLIAQSWLRDPNLFRFLIRRCLRILPALFVLVLVTAFMLGPWLSRLPASEYFAHPGTYNYLKNIVLYQ
jgi:peptidoglycan/LPS O-acetylase OafA/YrhL